MVLESSGKLHSKFILDHSTVSWDTPIQHPWRPQRLASMESDHSIWCVPFLRWRADDRRSTGSQTRWGRASDPWAAAALMTALRTPLQASFADQSAVDADDQHLPWSDESWDSQCKRTGTACMSCSGPLNSKASPAGINTFSRLAMAPLLKQPLKAVITAPQIPRARWTCCFWLKWSLHWKLSRLMPSEGTYQKYCKILDCRLWSSWCWIEWILSWLMWELATGNESPAQFWELISQNCLPRIDAKEQGNEKLYLSESLTP